MAIFPRPRGSEARRARRVRFCSWFLDGDEKPKTKSDPETGSLTPRLENRANSTAQVSPLRASTIRPATQHRLPGSTSIKTGLGPQEFHRRRPALPWAGPPRRAPRATGRHACQLRGWPVPTSVAGDGYRPGHSLQQPPCHAQANTFGLGNTCELVLFVPRDLDGVLQPLLEVLDMSLLAGELLLKIVDAGLDRSSVHGIDGLSGIAVKRLPRLLTILRHFGDVGVLAEKDGKAAGNPLRD